MLEEGLAVVAVAAPFAHIADDEPQCDRQERDGDRFCLPGVVHESGHKRVRAIPHSGARYMPW
jgi:hypothetical protein